MFFAALLPYWKAVDASKVGGTVPWVFKHPLCLNENWTLDVLNSKWIIEYLGIWKGSKLGGHPRTKQRSGTI